MGIVTVVAIVLAHVLTKFKAKVAGGRWYSIGLIRLKLLYGETKIRLDLVEFGVIIVVYEILVKLVL